MMECGFMVGDFAMTTYDRDLIEKYRGLTCHIVDDDCYDGFVRIVFDEDPNGEPGRTYITDTKVLTHICGEEPDCETISEFLNDM